MIYDREELERRKWTLLWNRRSAKRRLKSAEAEAARLREALDFYADPASWDVPNDDTGRGIPAAEDEGKVARAALAPPPQDGGTDGPR